MTGGVLDSLVEVPGGRIFVRRWHAGDRGRPGIILLHDSLGSVDQWRDFPEALAEATRREVLAYDRLGFGKSSPRTARPSLEFIREEATTFFPCIRRALDMDRFCLFGHSVGGAMALMIAASHAEACEAVITEAAQAFIEPRTLAGIRSARAEFDDPETFGRLVKWHAERARWVLDAWAGVWLSPEFRNWSLDPYLGQVRSPVLAIHGDSDEYGSEAFPRRIASQVSGPSELAILGGCGHVPHREQRAELLRLTSSFLERCAVSRQPFAVPPPVTDGRGV